MVSFGANELPKYVNELLNSEHYIDQIKIIDLRGVKYHGGTTLSSGVLPKWDFKDIRGFVKASSISAAGNWCDDAFHESYVMDLFARTGVDIAQAVPGFVFFYNIDTRKNEVRSHYV